MPKKPSLNGMENATQQKLQSLERHLQWQLFALDLLSEMSEIHDSSAASGDRESILRSLEECLSKMFHLKWGALLLVADDSGFNLQSCWPSDAIKTAQRRSDELIADGSFAWALNHNHPELRPARDGRPASLLNVIATRNDVHGMFVAEPAEHVRFNQAMKKMLAVVLSNAAYALENAALYEVVRRQRDDLETAVEMRNRELEYYSRNDVLTGQANRGTFIQRLDALIDSGQCPSAQVLLIDVDAFNRVNGSYGYQAGDRMLVELAGRLKAYFAQPLLCACFGIAPAEVIVARLGGDEFAVLLPDPRNAWGLGEGAAVVNDLITALSQPYAIEGELVHVRCSIGISSYPAHGADARSLLDCADIALHQVKLDNSCRYASYVEGMPDLRGPQSLMMEGALRRALEEGQLRLRYQPKVDLVSERITGAEALLRWQHLERGEIGPGEFIELAETSGLIVPIGEWLLGEVCRQQVQWAKAGLPALRVSLNLSAVQIGDPDLVERFAGIVAHEGADTRLIELELTETAIARDVEAAVRTLNALHELGFSVAIDDFGTGYSSLQLLRQFPLDALKIDKSFVRDLNSDPGDAAIVAAVVQMGHSLHLQVIAEGVENREQLNFLHSLGCHEVQGFFIARPLTAVDFAALLSAWRGIP
jgi:diguanylate cyclase (GGDEF)-like protein